jgi:hypothetical protein
MARVYVLQAQGFGDDEDAYENIGVFSSKERLETVLTSLQEEWAEDDLEVVTNVEEFELDL